MAEKKFFGFELQRFATVSSGEEFIAALTSGSDSSVSLNADITLDGSVSVTNSNLTSIDLGGHTITYTGTGTKTQISVETIKNGRSWFPTYVYHYGVLFFGAGINCSIDNGKFVAAANSSPPLTKTDSLFIAKDSASLTFGTGLDFSVQSSIPTAVAEMSGNGVLVMDGVDVNYSDNADGIAVSIGGSNNKVSINGGSITKKVGGGLYTKGDSNEITISGASISGYDNALNINGKNSTCLLDNASLSATMIAADFNNDSKVTIKSGYYESNTHHAITARDTSNLTVEGGTITGNSGIVNYGAGTVDIQSGSITGAYVAVHNYSGNGTVNISGGTISGIKKSDTATDIYGVCNEGSGIVSITSGTISGYRHGVYNKSTGTVNVSDGLIEGSYLNGIYNYTGTVDVSGGSIKGSNAGVYNEKGSAVISSGSITGGNNAIYNYGSKLTVKGGTITGTTAYDGIFNTSSGVVSISGGDISGARTGVFNGGSGGAITINGGNISKLADSTVTSYDDAAVYNNSSLANGDIVILDGTFTGNLSTRLDATGIANRTSKNGYSITGGDFDTFNYSSSAKLLAYTKGTNATLGYIGLEGWKEDSAENSWKYVESATDDGIGSAVATLTGADKTLTLTADKAFTLNTATDTPVSTLSDYTTLDASGNTVALNITGSSTFKEIKGGASSDSLTAGSVSATLDGGKGDDSLVGGAGADTFIYSAGSDTIVNFSAGGVSDVVSLSGLSGFSDGSGVVTAGRDLILNFGKNNSLTFAGGESSTITVIDGLNKFVYTKDSIAKNEGITLATGYHAATFDANIGEYSAIETINASAINRAISIIGNDKNNYIIGGMSGGSLYGGAGADSLIAGSNGATLNGGAGDDLLIGSKGAADTFIYSAGKDIISGYEIDKDNIVLTSISAITATDSLSVNDKSLTINFGSASALTFQNVSKVSITSGEDTYYYEPTYIVQNGRSISLGAGYGTVFNVNRSGFENLSTIDGSKIKNAIAITGNGENNYIIGGISGGTLNGGDGDDILKGGAGEDIFVYTGGSDSIVGYDPTKDLVSTAATFRPTADGISISGSDLILDFDGEKLTFINGAASAISLKSGRSDYTVTKDYFALGKGVTLTANNSASTFELTTNDTLDALLSAAVSIAGNAEKNYIIGSRAGGSIYGGAGNDRIDVTERNSDAKYIFRYTEGKDTVNGFSSDDSLTIDTNTITAAKATDNKFTITLSKDNVLNLSGDDISKVFLTTGDSLTADGLISKSGESAPMSLKLFASAKGDIDLGGDLYGNDDITAVNASAVGGQAVNIIGTSLGGAFTFASNRKKDTFTYGGGSATLSNFETGYDKLNLGELSIGSFTVDSLNNVSINAGDGQIVLEKVAGNEVLIHHGALRSNSYAKMIFAADGVLADKVKATSVTLSSGAKDYTATDNVKKITFSEGLTSLSATAGDKNNSTLDASVAGEGVTLVSGGKGDKFIGSANADLFVYTAGKDIIQNYDEGDQVSLNGVTLNDLSKVSASDKSVKLAFSGSNNVLNVKGTGLAEGGLTIDGKKYTFAKNAIIDSDEHASLTSAASGTIKTKSVANYIDGTGVKKNLTFSGGTDDETFIGGAKKTVFKGGGGDDTLIGGEGKDTFFYAKGSEGEVTIQKFDFINDNLKIANGTIGKISSISGGVEFTLTDGKKKEPGEAGSYKIESSATYDSNGVASNSPIDAGNILIKANSTYYWFAQEAAKDIDDNDIAIGDLITDIKSVAAAKITESDYNVIDLTYSTNLVKSGVAKQLKSAT